MLDWAPNLNKLMNLCSIYIVLTWKKWNDTGNEMKIRNKVYDARKNVYENIEQK